MSYRVDDYDPYGALLEAEEQDGGSYFGRHWRGHLSLPQSYWVNGFVTNLVVTVLGFTLAGLERAGFSLRTLSFAVILYLVCFLVVRTWTSVGIWRSASRHAARGGSPGWGVVARVMVAIGILATLAQLPSVSLQAKEYGLIAIGKDPLGPPAVLTVDAQGKTVSVKGILSAGIASDFEHALQKAPALERVQLESDGGRIAEAVRMAKVIRQRGLDTRVEQHCESACTLLLLAGKDRSAHQLAQIGFHQPDFPGITEKDRIHFIAENRRDYEAEGIEPRFLDRVFATPANDMWYPTHSEMVNAKVLTAEEITVGSHKSDQARLYEMLASMAEATNASKGTKLDDMTELEGATLSGTSLRIRHKVTKDVTQTEARNLQHWLDRNLAAEFCDSAKRNLIQMGARFELDYRGADGRPIASVRIERCPTPV